jgi:hypothetical protein
LADVSAGVQCTHVSSDPSGGPAAPSRGVTLALLAVVGLALGACGTGGSRARARPTPRAGPTAITTPRTGAKPRVAYPASAANVRPPFTPLPPPAALVPFRRPAARGEGVWHAAGRRVGGAPAVYETTLVPPGGASSAGIAWMDTRLLSARLYSGSESPGGGPYRYTAPVRPAAARSLVAAFNGGFLMDAAEGGYYTEHRVVDPLRRGAAALVIYSDGSVDVGAWGSDVRMTPRVVGVRQNLSPLVAGGLPTPRAADWRLWGSTCGASSCAHSVPGIPHQWRSALGVTADRALVYVQGPALDPLQLAELLARSGAVRGMQLDINPDWPIFATYDPAGAHASAAPANGRKLLASTVRGPETFFEAWWARDFITMSAR